MPLTTEEVTAITADLKAGKTVGEIELLKPLGDVVVRTKEANEAYELSLTKKIEDETIAPRISEIYTTLDNEIEASSGIKRNQDEKTFDYQKRVLADMKTKSDSSDSTIAEMKKQIEAEGADVLRKDKQALQLKYDTDIAAKNEEAQTMRTSVIRHDKLRILDIGYGDVSKKFKTELPDYFEAHKDNVYDDIMNHSELSVDGKSLILFKSNGKKIYGANHEEMSLETRLNNDFKAVIQEGDGGGGAGGGIPPNPNPNPDTKPNEGNAWDALQVPAEVKNGIQLRDWMIDQKLKDTYGEDFNKAYNSILDKSKLPLM